MASKGFIADKAALFAFVDAIEATGGVKRDRQGFAVPVGDIDWVDLGEAYLLACVALEREPVYTTEDSKED